MAGAYEDDDIPEVYMPNELEQGAVNRFLQRQAAARQARQERNTELRPSAHRYASPGATPAAAAGSGTGYASRHGFGSSTHRRGAGGAVAAAWNPSTLPASRPPRPVPRRFESDLAAKYQELTEQRRQASLDASVVVEPDFRPEIARLLEGFKARCRNRVRDMSVHQVWRKMQRDAPPPREADAEAAAAEAAEAEAEAADSGLGAGSGRWIHRQRAARQRHEFVAQQTTLRASTHGAGAADAADRTGSNNNNNKPGWNASTIPERTATGAISPSKGSQQQRRGGNGAEGEALTERQPLSLDTLREFRAANNPRAADTLLAAIKQTLGDLEVADEDGGSDGGWEGHMTVEEFDD